MSNSLMRSKLTKGEVSWQTVIFIAITITALEAPFSFTFKTRIQNWQLVLDAIISLIFTVDVFYQLREKRKNRVNFASTSEKLNWWIMLGIDVIASIPFDIIGYYSGAQEVQAFSFIRIFRLARIIRLLSLFGQLTVVPKPFRLSFLFVSFVLGVHWISCAWINITPGDIPANHTSHYIKALYWTVTTLTTIGYGDITPQDDLGRLFTMIVMISGVGVYGIVIGNVSRMIVAGEKFKEETRQKMTDLASFMKYYNVPERLQNNVFHYYQHLLTKRLTDNDNKIISDLPHALQQEMQIYMNIKLIRNLPIFRDCSTACLKDVAAALEQKYFGPGQTVINIGEVGQEMYIVGHGLVEVILSDGNVVATLHEGQFFGEVALLKETKRNANVRAQTYCDLYKLNKEDFVKIIEDHPELQENISSMHSRRDSDRRAQKSSAQNS